LESTSNRLSFNAFTVSSITLAGAAPSGDGTEFNEP
jgi:hypothetical protein